MVARFGGGSDLKKRLLLGINGKTGAKHMPGFISG